jgi:hypothetical protein
MGQRPIKIHHHHFGKEDQEPTRTIMLEKKSEDE